MAALSDICALEWEGENANWFGTTVAPFYAEATTMAAGEYSYFAPLVGAGRSENPGVETAPAAR
jgi:hypothetical protein